MTWAFMRYFFNYIFLGKSKQRLLFIALCGLMVSSFALLVLQCTMGGLQRNLILRSKVVTGDSVIFLHEKSSDFVAKVLTFLEQKGIDANSAYPEYEIELLLRHDTFLSPVQVHGIDFKGPLPAFLQGHPETAIGVGVMQRVRAEYGSSVNLISPSHTDSFLGDVPRQVSTEISSVVTTELVEIDDFHLWTRIGLIHNLIHNYDYNVIRIYHPDAFNWNQLRRDLTEQFGEKVLFKTWEEQNDSLVWSLNLETKVMFFLFVAMTCLVGIAITSGLLIFFGKIQIDLVSFWMLGLSRRKLEKLSLYLVNLLSFGASVVGLMLGAGFLFMLDRYSALIMPDIFLEQKIPIYVNAQSILTSLIIPYLFAATFSWFSLNHFKRDQRSFATQMRSIS